MSQAQIIDLVARGLLLTKEDKWIKVRDYYERSYFNPALTKLPFKFAHKPSDLAIQYLYDKMKIHKKEMALFYEDHPFLEQNLYALRGHVHSQSPILKHKNLQAHSGFVSVSIDSGKRMGSSAINSTGLNATSDN